MSSVGGTEVVGARVSTMVGQQWQTGGGQGHRQEGRQGQQEGGPAPPSQGVRDGGDRSEQRQIDQRNGTR